MLAWWGSIPGGHATIGDALALRAVAIWAARHGLSPVIAATRETTFMSIPTVDWRNTDPEDIAAFCFVCGPLMLTDTLRAMMKRFEDRPRLALGVSVLHPSWFGWFDDIFVRDSDTATGFDFAPADVNQLAALFPGRPEPAATAEGTQGLRMGVCLRGPQMEYGGIENSRHDNVAQSISALRPALAARWHDVDTVYHREKNPLANMAAAFPQSDLVITTRMHGALMALAYARPVIAIDQIAGGRKVARLLGKIGFPFLLHGDGLTPGRLAETAGSVLAAPRELWLDLRRRMIAEADGALEAAGAMIMSAAEAGLSNPHRRRTPSGA